MSTRGDPSGAERSSSGTFEESRLCEQLCASPWAGTLPFCDLGERRLRSVCSGGFWAERCGAGRHGPLWAVVPRCPPGLPQLLDVASSHPCAGRVWPCLQGERFRSPRAGLRSLHAVCPTCLDSGL